MPLGAEIGLGPGHIVLDRTGTQLPQWKGAQHTHLSAVYIVAKWSPVSATAALLL